MELHKNLSSYHRTFAMILFTVLLTVGVGIEMSQAAKAKRQGTDATERVGGPGGNRTVVMDCGSNSFIVGIKASGGKYRGIVDMNLVRKLQFRCKSFKGMRPGREESLTAEAEGKADKRIIMGRQLQRSSVLYKQFSRVFIGSLYRSLYRPSKRF